MPKKVLLIVFIITVITVFASWFYYQRNVFSQDDLRFSVELSKDDVSLGESVDYVVSYKNNGDIRLENATLLFEYPESSFPQEMERDDVTKRGELRREVDLGDISPGEEGVLFFPARLFGKEGDYISADARISYIPRNLNVRYESQREHNLRMGSVPIDFAFDFPSNVEADKEETFRLKYESDVDYPLTDLEVRVQFPSEFEIKGSNPRMGEDNDWSISLLNRGEGGTIDIEGVLEGEPGDAKVFEALLGIWRDNTFIPIKETSRGVSIAEPLLFVTMQANESSDYVADPGDLLYYEIFFKNMSDDAMENLFVTAKLDREVIEFDEVEPLTGRFQKETGSILWNHALDSTLRSLSSGQEESVSFYAPLRDELPFDPQSRLEVDVDGVKEELVTKINTKLNIFSEIVMDSEEFDEVGPFPLLRGEESTYVVRLEVENMYTDAEDVEVSATLPRGAEITEEVYPEEEEISFDSKRREVKWEVGDLYRDTQRELLFEVVIEPQEDDLEELMSEVTVTGVDIITEKEVSSSADALLLEIEEDEEEL